MFLYSVSLLRRFVSAGRARPPHGTVRIGVEKAPAQQTVYLRFNLQLRWSSHTAALYHRGDWRREWIVYTSFIINRPVSDIKYLQFIWMVHFWCDWVGRCIVCAVIAASKKHYKVSSITTCALNHILNHNTTLWLQKQQSVIKHNSTSCQTQHNTGLKTTTQQSALSVVSVSMLCLRTLKDICFKGLRTVVFHCVCGPTVVFWCD